MADICLHATGPSGPIKLGEFFRLAGALLASQEERFSVALVTSV